MKNKRKSYSFINIVFFSSVGAAFLIFTVLIVSLMYEKYSYFNISVSKAYKTHLEYQKGILKQRIDNLVAMMEDTDILKSNLSQTACDERELETLKKEIFLNLISKSRYGRDSNGYYYVVRKMDGRVVMHPIDSTLVGMDVRKIVDVNGLNIGEEIFSAIESAEDSFFKYYWAKPSTGRPSLKLAYARYISRFDWIIVTGIYIDDFEKGIFQYQDKLKKEIIKNTTFIIVKLFIILIAFWGVLFYVRQKFMGDIETISRSFDRAVLYQEEVDVNTLQFKEFTRLSEYLNIIVGKNSMMYKKLRYYAEKDQLTDLFNRRKFMENLDREFASCKRYKYPVSLLMLDLDHFKKVNDSLGHAAGDVALKKFAEILAGNIRDVDIAGRIGGEEFAVLMPNTEKDKAVFVAERIRKAVENGIVEFEGSEFSLTVSIGVASIPPADLKESAELLKIADSCLYKAKSSGRNQVRS